MSARQTAVETGVGDAYCTTGTSPGLVPAATHVISTDRASDLITDRAGDRGRARPGDATTVHLLGPGAVGSAFLRMLPPDCILTGVTDTTATLRGTAGIDPGWIAASKRGGRALRTQPGARALAPADALDWVGAHIVVDATATDFARDAWAAVLDQGVLARGGHLVLAAKDALCRAAPRWLRGETRARVGCNAVLGGTGRLLQRELDGLRERCVSVAIAGNASTTTILQALERGETLDDGIADARRRGFLEADPELDLRGEDAAVKLAIVAGALRGRSFDPAAIPCEDVRELDPALVRERALRGRTTRLIARADEYGALEVRYEEVLRGSPLASPLGRVVYAYALEDGATRLHVGAGLGEVATARALRADVAAFAAQRRTVTAAGAEVAR